MRPILGGEVQASTTQHKEEVIILADASTETLEKKIYCLKLTYLLQTELSHVSGSYFSQFYDVAQVNQNMKALLLRE